MQATKSFVSLILVIMLGMMSHIKPVSAQETGPSSGSKSPSFQSSGLKTNITSVTLVENQVLVQMLLENTRKEGLYAILIEGGQGTTNTGSILNFGGTTGFPTCSMGCGREIKEPENQQYTFMEPGQSVVLGVQYAGNKPKGSPDTFTFALRFITRTAAATNAQDATGKPMGPAAFVTINFPLIPFKKD